MKFLCTILRLVLCALACLSFGLSTQQAYATVPTYYVPTNYLPTNGRYSNPGYWQQYAPGIVIRDVVLRQVPLVGPPPALGGNQSYTFSCQMDCYMSLDGGASFSFKTAPVTATVWYNHTASGSYTETYATEVFQLDIAGGDFGFVMLRESPTLASTGTQHTATKGGRYSVDSFFDIFTEVSVDGGANWYPSTVGSGRLIFSYPPECRFDNALYPPLPADAKYTDNGADTVRYTGNVWIRSFNFNLYTMSQPLPPPGGSQVHTFSDMVRFEMTFDAGATWSPITTMSAKQIRVTSVMDVSPARFFDTEMLTMNIMGGSLPPGWMIRESPTRASLGKLNVETLPSPYGYTFSSFFDIFTEMSMDGGGSWHPGSRTIPVYLVRNPEVDVFSQTLAQMTIQSSTMETIYLIGPTTVNVFIPPDGSASDNDEDGRDEVYADMESMSLSGTSPMAGPITVRLDPRSRTWGQIEENANANPGTLDLPPFTLSGTASSFFDVFFEVNISGMRLYGTAPAHMQATITHKPPAQGETYQMFGPPIALVDSLGHPTPFTLMDARHTPNPEIEVDDFPNSKAQVQISFPDMSWEVVKLSGPTTVDVFTGPAGGASDIDGDGLDQVPTEIVSMNLTGTSTSLGPVTLRLRDVTKDPFRPTLGEIEENLNATPGTLDLPPFTPSGTASSFFDVFFEIETPMGFLHNGTPKHMHTVITHKPPAQGETYEDMTVIGLLDESNNPTGISIAYANHTPIPFGVISGYKWKDNDNNGIWDRGEPSLSGWTISLTGPVSTSTATNDTGWYEFTGLPAGSYEVQETPQTQWSKTYPPSASHAITLGVGEEVRGRREYTEKPNFGNYKIPHDCPPWVQRFDKKKEGMGFNIPTDAKLMTRNLAIRDTGDIYVCGYSDGYGTKLDYVTIKYDEYGTVLWTQRYNNSTVNKDDKAYALTIDAEGNVYVTGESDGGATKMDMTTVKYSPAGAELWVARWNNTTVNGRDAGYAIALNPSETIVYVTGETDGKPNKSDYVTMAYDAATGAPVWASAQTYNGPGNKIDKAYAIAVDAAKNVIVTGESDGGGTKADYCTIKYNGSTSALVWAARYDGPVSRKDYAFAITTDPISNDVYVTGASESDRKFDYCTIKYTSGGAPAWPTPARYDGFGKKDYAYDITLDISGYVYVTGGSEGNKSKLDFLTVKYDPLTGDTVWTNRQDGGFKKADIGRSVRVCDDSMKVFVTGSSDQGSGRKLDYFTQKINAGSGATEWIGRYNGPVGKNDIAYNVRPRKEDCCVVLTGTSDGGATKLDFATIQGPAGAAVPGPITTPAVYDGEGDADLPQGIFALGQNYPNPFNPTTTVRFELGAMSIVTLRVYNVLGQEVATLINSELMDEGQQEVDFDASTLPSGVYFYRIRAERIADEESGIVAETFTDVKKMVVMK